MTDHYQNFQDGVKKIESEKRSRVTRRYDKIVDIAKNSVATIKTSSTNPKYRNGWDRIFANKQSDTTENESPE